MVLPELWLRCTPSLPLQWASPMTRNIGFSTTLPLALAAIVFSSIWDNLIFSKGVFTFDSHSMLGVIGAMPMEEWLWFVDHTTLASIFTLAIMGPCSDAALSSAARSPPLPHSASEKIMVLGLGVGVSAAGFALAFTPGSNEHFLFLGVLMGFMPPVITLQWWFGGEIFRRHLGAQLSSGG